MCEGYKVGWDFVIAPEQQQQWQPHQNHAASHTGEGPSCNIFRREFLDKERKVVDMGHSRYDINSRYISISMDKWVCLSYNVWRSQRMSEVVWGFIKSFNHVKC